MTDDSSKMDEGASTGNPGTHAPNAAFKSGADHARKAAEDFRTAATEKAGELRTAAEDRAREFRRVAEERAKEFQTRARTLGEDADTYVRENPLRAVATALGIGFVLGLIFRR